MDDPFIYGLLIISLFFFLLLKYALVSVNQLQLELDKKKINSQSRVLNYISKNTTEFKVSINISYFINLVILVFFFNNLTSHIFQVLNNFFYPILILATISILLSVTVIITFAEYFANKIIQFFAIPLIAMHVCILPLTKILMLFHHKTSGHLNTDNQDDDKKKFDKKDLGKLVSDSQLHTNNDSMNSEIKFFLNALEFSELKVRECMIPRTELIAIEITDLQEELKQRFIQSGHSKILVYKDSTDNIIGYIKSKSLFSPNLNLKNSIKNLPIFPESMNINKLLKHFNRMGQNIAVIVDEFGGTSGIVTTEDILEEIFGEIKDEHDAEDLYEKKLSDTSYEFSGRLEIDYINEKYNLNIPDDDEYETIAGFILSHTENIPKLNELITIGSFIFRIVKVSDTRVELVKLEIEDE